MYHCFGKPNWILLDFAIMFKGKHYLYLTILSMTNPLTPISIFGDEIWMTNHFLSPLPFFDTLSSKILEAKM